MDLSGVLGDSQLKRYLLVEQTPNEQHEHLSLARRESLVSGGEPLVFHCLLPICPILSHRPFTGVDQRGRVNRFCKKVNRAVLHRTHCHRDVTSRGDENDWYSASLCLELRLQFE